MKSARPTSEIASSCETLSLISLVVEPLNSLRTTLEIQPRFVIAALGRTLPSRANTIELAPSSSSPVNPSLLQGLPVEGDLIGMETARRDHAQIGRVPTHCEQTPYPLQLTIVFQ